MKKRVSKTSKRSRLGILAIIAAALIIGCAQLVFADGEYTIYNAALYDDGHDEYHATTATSLSDYTPDTDPLVYCINANYSRPQAAVAGISGYTKTSDANDTEISNNIVYNDNAKYIRAVLYYGYPNLGNNNEWKSTYVSEIGLSFPSTDFLMRVYTQAAIWYLTDSEPVGGSQSAGYILAALAKEKVDNGEFTEDVNVDLYTTTDGVSQNFIGLESTETSTTTSVSVQVDKSWMLSTGEEYTGTKPDVSFSLYEGEGTTGTLVDTQTLGDDDTVTFSGIDTTSETTYTLVETISGSVTGYTFTPAENQTIDLSSVANGETKEVNVENKVTPTTEEETTEDTTKVNVKVNKTWALSTGGAYDGTKPEVSFSLYKGTDTTGTPVATQTLGNDDTVTFSSADITSGKKYTLVEKINGTVTGYTFTPAENQTIDLSNATNGETKEVNVENKVTPTTEENNNNNNSSSESTGISVKVNKAWKLTTGETYTGEKPEVTFTLYGGEGTTGKNYGTVTLGDDDTAVFENIDPADYEKFTLVENIDGTVSGYTFQPCDDIVIDINDISSDNVLEADAVNEVTQEKTTVTNTSDKSNKSNDSGSSVSSSDKSSKSSKSSGSNGTNGTNGSNGSEKTAFPKTGDETNMGLYLGLVIAGAIGLVLLRKRTAK
jgi:TQXA domain-containing protein/LPXTG-motif cell wall-anchored protein